MFPATTPPDTETVINDGFSEVTSLITSVLAPALFALVVLGLGIALGVKWVRKGAKSA